MPFKCPLGCTETLSNPLYLHADIDECEVDDLNNCHENAQCTDTVGSYTCSCNPGYTGDGVACRSKLLMERVYVQRPCVTLSAFMQTLMNVRVMT